MSTPRTRPPRKEVSEVTMQLIPDLKHKMSKKIAQLTKVIYHMHTRNDDREAELAGQASAYEDEIEMILRDAHSKLSQYKTQLDQQQDRSRTAEALKVMQKQHAEEKAEALEDIEKWKAEAENHQKKAAKASQFKIIELKEEVTLLKSEFEKQIITFQELSQNLKTAADTQLRTLKTQLDDDIKRIREDGERSLTKLRLEKERQEAELTRTLQLQKDDELKSQAAKMEAEKLEAVANALNKEEQRRLQALQEAENLASTDKDSLTKTYNSQIAELQKQETLVQGQLHQSQIQNKKLQEDMEELYARITLLSSNAEASETEIKSLKESLLVVEQMKEELETLKTKLQDDISQLSATLAQKGERVEDLEKAEQHLKDELKTAVDLNGMKDADLKDKTAAILRLENQIIAYKSNSEKLASSSSEATRSLTNANAALQAELDAANQSAKESLEAARAEVLKINMENKKLLDERTTLQQDVSLGSAEIAKLITEGDNLKSRSEGLEIELQKVKTEHTELTSQVAELQRSLEGSSQDSASLKIQADAEITGMKQTISSLEEQISDLKAKLEANEGERKTLENARKSLESNTSTLQQKLETLQKSSSAASAQSARELKDERSRAEAQLKELNDKMRQISQDGAASASARERDARQSAEQEWAEKLCAGLDELRRSLQSEAATKEKKLEALYDGEKKVLNSQISDLTKELEETKFLKQSLVSQLSSERENSKKALENLQKIQKEEVDHLNAEALILKQETEQFNESSLQAALQKQQKDSEELLNSKLQALEESHAHTVEQLQLQSALDKTEMTKSFEQARSQAIRDENARIARIKAELADESLKKQNALQEKHRSDTAILQSALDQSRGVATSSKKAEKELTAQVENLKSQIKTKDGEIEKAAQSAIFLRRENERLLEDELARARDEASAQRAALQAQMLSKMQKLQTEHEVAVERLNEQMQKQSEQIELGIEKYHNRPSRDEDLQRMALLEGALTEKENALIKAKNDLQYFKLELVNREENYNKVFGRQPIVGVMDASGSMSVNSKKKASTSAVFPPLSTRSSVSTSSRSLSATSRASFKDSGVASQGRIPSAGRTRK